MQRRLQIPGVEVRSEGGRTKEVTSQRWQWVRMTQSQSRNRYRTVYVLRLFVFGSLPSACHTRLVASYAHCRSVASPIRAASPLRGFALGPYATPLLVADVSPPRAAV